MVLDRILTNEITVSELVTIKKVCTSEAYSMST